MRLSVKASVGIVCSLLLVLPGGSGPVLAQSFAGGTGQAYTPYQVATTEQLLSIGSDPNLLDKCFVLVADIDLDPNLPDGQVFETALIAPDVQDANGVDQPGVPFTGFFDGRNHTIANLTISAPSRYAVGLFGRIGVERPGEWEVPAKVQNLHLEKASVAGYEMAGGLAGVNAGTILNCSMTGYVMAQKDVAGGLVGSNAGTLAMCHAEGEVHGHDFVGGMTANNLGGAITRCSWAGTVDGSEIVGGLVGRSTGYVGACSASGLVTGGENVGGLLARNNGIVILSKSTSDVCGDDYVGGLVEWNSGAIAQCYARGNVTAREIAAGLVAYNKGAITACYATGRVQVTGDEGIGGLVGRARSAAVDSSFWDVDTTGFTLGVGGTGLHTAQMQTAQPYLDAGWDFVGTWMICEGTDYPRLRWEQYDCPGDG